MNPDQIIRRSCTKREARLAAPRQVSDPKHGFLGTIQKVETGWTATNAKGWALSHLPFHTARIAVKALYRDAGLDFDVEMAKARGDA